MKGYGNQFQAQKQAITSRALGLGMQSWAVTNAERNISGVMQKERGQAYWRIMGSGVSLAGTGRAGGPEPVITPALPPDSGAATEPEEAEAPPPPPPSGN